LTPVFFVYSREAVVVAHRQASSIHLGEFFYESGFRRSFRLDAVAERV